MNNWRLAESEYLKKFLESYHDNICILDIGAGYKDTGSLLLSNSHEFFRPGNILDIG